MFWVEQVVNAMETVGGKGDLVGLVKLSLPVSGDAVMAVEEETCEEGEIEGEEGFIDGVDGDDLLDDNVEGYEEDGDYEADMDFDQPLSSIKEDEMELLVENETKTNLEKKSAPTISEKRMDLVLRECGVDGKRAGKRQQSRQAPILKGVSSKKMNTHLLASPRWINGLNVGGIHKAGVLTVGKDMPKLKNYVDKQGKVALTDQTVCP